MLWRLKPSLYGATFRGRLAQLAGGSLGAALAALVIASGAWPPSSRATPLQLRRLSLRDNKQHLSAAEMTTLLHWARRYRACAVRHGAPLDVPTRGQRDRGPSLDVRPAVVSPGGDVRVAGNAAGCARGATVFVLSRVFAGRSFAGVGAITARARAQGSFSAFGRVRSNARAGAFVATARCGGLSIGVSARFRVR